MTALRSVVTTELIRLRFASGAEIIACGHDRYGVLAENRVTYRPSGTLRPGDVITGRGRLVAVSPMETVER